MTKQWTIIIAVITLVATFGVAGQTQSAAPSSESALSQHTNAQMTVGCQTPEDCQISGREHLLMNTRVPVEELARQYLNLGPADKSQNETSPATK